MIKGILFDFDGTLSDRAQSVYFMYRDLVKRLMPQLPVDSAEYEAVVQRCMVWDEYGRISKPHVMEELKKHYLPDLDVAAEVKRWYEVFSDFQVEQPGCYRTLKKLGERYELGVVTNGKVASQNAKIDKLDLRKYFRTVIVSRAFGKDKPDPAIYQQAASDLGLVCQEVAYIGDTFATDILGAIRSGMMPIWFNSNQTCISLYPVRQLHTYEEIEHLFLEDTAWNV